MTAGFVLANGKCSKNSLKLFQLMLDAIYLLFSLLLGSDAHLFFLFDAM